MRTIIDNYENIKRYLQVCIFDPELHEDYFDDRVITIHGDFCAYYRIPLCENTKGNTLTVIINNQMVKNWGIDPAELAVDAFDAMWDYRPEVLCFLDEGLPKPVPLKLAISMKMYGCNMIGLTNKENIRGAGLILNNDIRKAIGEIMCGNFIVLPSSVHDVMVCRDDGSVGDDALYNMVKEANESGSIVDPEDVLSNKVQWCSADGEIMIGLREARETKGL